MRRWQVLFVLLLAAGCATAGQPQSASPLAGIASWNEEELFACGTAAWQAEDFPLAATCFGHLADTFPQSRRWRDAVFNTGAAWEAQEQWEKALERYLSLIDPVPARGKVLDAVWRAGTCLYQLDRYEEAVELLTPYTTAPDIPDADRIHALTYVGVCKVELGELSQAEIDLRNAIHVYRKADAEAEERLDDYFAAQAQFFLGEIYRLHFELVRLEAVDELERLGEQLEYKAQLLLSAQGHYLRTIRMGNGHWGTAAGARVGGLYEKLYDEMTLAPVPEGLDEAQASLYRGVLRRKVRILVQKAISIYERTLSTAERIGVRSGFVEQTRQSLDRMKQILLADAARDEAEGITEEDLERQADPGA